MIYFSANRPKIFTASLGSTVVSVTVASALSWVKVHMLLCRFVGAMKALVVDKREIKTVDAFMMLCSCQWI